MSWLSPLKAPGSHRYLDLKELLHFFFEKKNAIEYCKTIQSVFLYHRILGSTYSVDPDH